MSSHARQVIEQIATQIATVNGSAPYSFDLSGTGKVVVGQGLVPSRVPSVGVYPVSFTAEHGPELGRFTRKMTIGLLGIVAGTTSTPSDRALRAFDLLDDVVVALESDRSLNGLVLDLIVSKVDVTGDENDLPTMGAFVAQLEVYWRASSGTGV